MYTTPTMKIQKLLQLLLVMVFCLGFAATTYAGNGKPGNKDEDEPDSINFMLKDTSGKTVSLNDFKGKFVVIDFWASWCGPCMQESAATKALAKSYASNPNVVFVFISFDQNEDIWHDKVEEMAIPGVHLFGTPDKEDLKQMFNFNSLPYYVWINKKGVIVDKDASRPSEFGTKVKLKAFIAKN